MVMILLTGDTHLGFDQPRRGQGGAHRRGEDFFANVERVFRRAVELKVDLLLHGGDLFHRSQEPPAVVDRAFHLLHVLAAEGSRNVSFVRRPSEMRSPLANSLPETAWSFTSTATPRTK